ncbi:MAG TPA: hypothetical protein VH420_09385, partial [Gaiellaceae bacterium]
MQTESDLSVERSRRRSAAQEGGLPELLDALRWRWKPTVLIAALFTLGATIYVETLPSQYDGKALLSIGPRLGQDSSVVRVVG